MWRESDVPTDAERASPHSEQHDNTKDVIAYALQQAQRDSEFVREKELEVSRSSSYNALNNHDNCKGHESRTIRDGHTSYATESVKNTTYILPGTYRPQSCWRLKCSGWSFGVYRSAIFALLVFTVNFAIDITLVSKFETAQGSGTVMTGSCRRVRAADVAIHVILNIFSTLIIGACNYCMQGLCSPTREEVDRQHERRKWVDIGFQSIRNLRAVKRWNAAMWIVLGIAVVPLHLVFNATFYTTSQANQYAVAVVSQDFLHTTWTPTSEDIKPEQYTSINGSSPQFTRKDDDAVPRLLINALVYYRNPNNFTHLSPEECIKTYSNGFVTNYSGVVVVTKARNSSNPLLWSRYPERYSFASESNSNAFKWICSDFSSADKELDRKVKSRCEQDLALKYLKDSKKWTMAGHEVDYCLSQLSNVEDTCQLQFNQWLMLMVLGFALIQTAIMCFMAWRCWHSNDHALRTMGDAVASFIEREDPTTEGMCLVPTRSLTKEGWKQHYDPIAYDRIQRPRWSSSVGNVGWYSTLLFGALVLGTLGFLLREALYGQNRSSFSDGLGRANAHALTSVIDHPDASTTTVLPTIVVANSPQLVFTVLYLAFNVVFTRMLLAREWSRFSRRRKELRVTGVQYGLQKATRMLSIPGRYALALMAYSALVHLFISQSLFFVRVDVLDVDGHIDGDDVIAGLGYSAVGITVLLVLILAGLLAILAFGRWGRLEPGMPGDGSNSALISAACHLRGEPPGAERGRLIWGDVEFGYDGRNAGHCAFSAVGAVQVPLEGKEYI